MLNYLLKVPQQVRGTVVIHRMISIRYRVECVVLHLDPSKMSSKTQPVRLLMLCDVTMLCSLRIRIQHDLNSLKLWMETNKLVYNVDQWQGSSAFRYQIQSHGLALYCSDNIWNVLFPSGGFSDERHPDKLKSIQRSWNPFSDLMN